VDPQQAIDVTAAPEHAALALRAAEQSAILLQNRHDLLPLDPAKLRRLAVIGPHAKLAHLGPDRDLMTTVYDGLAALLPPDVELRYAQGCHLTTKDGKPSVYLEETADTPLTELQKLDLRHALDDAHPRTFPLAAEQPLIHEAARTATGCDAAILVLGESTQCIGENYTPYSRDRDDLALLGNQVELLRAVQATGVPTIVLLVRARALAIEPVAQLADAILDLGEPGERRGAAAARLLLGLAEPGGRLPVTLPLSVGQLPCHYSLHAQSFQRGYALRDARTCLFPFGFGLSYTTFSFSAPVVSAPVLHPGESLNVSVRVTNTGPRPGTAVVQAYVTDCQASLLRPARELKAFARLRLEPGEERTVPLRLGTGAFSFCNAAGQEIAEPGEFLIATGPHSADLQQVSVTLT